MDRAAVAWHAPCWALHLLYTHLRASSLPGSPVQEDVVREAESKQALLTEAAQNTGNEAQRQEDVSSGQVRRLLDAALRHRMNDQPSSLMP